MLALSGALFAYPLQICKPIKAIASKPSNFSLSSSISPRYHLDSPFVPEVENAVASLHSEFRYIDNVVAHNTSRVLKAYQNAHVGSHFFAGCTGYGHDEAGGREGLDQAFAEIFGAESAIVRSHFFSGTHAITCALFAMLRPGDELLVLHTTLWRKSLESETAMGLAP